VTWSVVRSEADVEALLDSFGGFHDACVREAHLWTDHWVAADLSMSCPGNLDTRIRILVHRQFRNPAAIELLFEEVTRFNLVPTPENYDSIIFSATLLLRDGQIYWSPEENWSPESPNRDRSTWLSSRKLRWRDASEWLGKALHYGSGDPEEDAA
jgi:chorismate mutase